MLNSPILLTSFALLAFAANSVFCRIALGEQQIDAGSFTIIRLLSGSLFLGVVLAVKLTLSDKPSTDGNSLAVSDNIQSRGSWLNALWLFIYALTFSFAYIQLDTATGALVLFATVQVTMLFIGLFKGRKLSLAEWLGLSLAIAGFIYLLAPQMGSPSLFAFMLMMLSGIAWALYTLAGKSSVNPSSDTIFNFIRTVPFVLIFAVLNIDMTYITFMGILNAVLSGVLASALGYLLWYQALKTLRHSVAAVVQLLVPVLAALMGFMIIGESVSTSFVISSTMILGGILLVAKNPKLKILMSSK